MEYKSNRERIIQYIKSGEKPEKDFTMGLEFEYIVVEKDSLKSIPYKNGVENILCELLQKGWKRVGDKSHILSLQNNGDNITLEPGAQLELSMKNCTTIKEIEERYFNFVNDILPIAEKYNYLLLAMGYRPADKIEDIAMIPKKRYEYMSRYLSQRGKYALNMMKGSAALQISIDYKDELDYIKKFRVANYLSPAASLLYDNTPIFEGEKFSANGARVQIWNNMDDDRSKLIPGVLEKEFNYGSYADYMLERPCIFAPINGENIYTDDKLVKDIYQNQELSINDIEHIFSMFFPDVRTKKYIEIRMIDSVPYPYNLSAAALWKGILYNKGNLDYFYEESLKYTDEKIQELKDGMIVNDESVISILNETIYKIFVKVESALDCVDFNYLQPLREVFENYLNLNNLTKKRMDKMPLAEALDMNAVKAKESYK